MPHLDVIRDPLYGPIVLDPTAQRLVDTEAYQRLRRIRQLSMASEVYPSAMHTRFEHAVGVYHLSGRIIENLAARGDLDEVAPTDVRLVRLAALLHDVGHFSGAHLLEEVDYPGACHERAGEDWFARGEIGRALRETGIPRAAERIAALVQHRSDHPLAGIVSGDCDADKMDYLVRDAYHCGLPAVFDQVHLSLMLTLVDDPRTGRRTLGLDVEGLPSFEAMLYAKFALYRSVYFNSVARAATAMMRTLLVAALDAGLLEMEELHRWTDDEVFTLLRHRVVKKRNEHARLVRSLVSRLTSRQLYKPAASLPLGAATGRIDHATLQRLERAAEERLGLDHGQVIIDVPRKPTMLSTDLPVRLRDGSVVAVNELGPEHGVALPAVRDQFYAASGRIHLFTTDARTVPAEILADLLASVQSPSPAEPVVEPVAEPAGEAAAT